jgi:hypothetical protein
MHSMAPTGCESPLAAHGAFAGWIELAEALWAKFEFEPQDSAVVEVACAIPRGPRRRGELAEVAVTGGNQWERGYPSSRLPLVKFSRRKAVLRSSYGHRATSGVAGTDPSTRKDVR